MDHLDDENLLYAYRNLKGLLKCVEAELILRGVLHCKVCGVKHKERCGIFVVLTSA